MKTLKWMLCLILAAAPLMGGEFKLPKYETLTLKNGLTIYLMEQHEVPLIQISAAFRAGAALDGDHYGLAGMTADGLLFGTKTWSKTQIEEELDFLGATINTGVAHDEASLAISLAARDLDKVMPIFVELMTAPSFDEAEFEKKKKRDLLGLERNRESPRSVIGSYYAKMIYGDHPYANPISGLVSTISELKADDLRGFYKQHYVPNNCAIAVVGDFDAKTMKKQLKTAFKGWKKGKKAKKHKGKNKAKNASPSSSRVLLVNKNDARETTFLFGFKGVPLNNPDRTELLVINTILGGRFTSWLNTELRVNTGLTYGARSRFDSNRDAGVFLVSSFTRTKETVRALDLAIETMNRLHGAGIDQETLTSAKNYLKGQFPPRYERASSLAGFLTDMYIYDLDVAFINDFQKRVGALSLARANELVAKYFQKDNLQMVLVGKASEIREDVKKYGELTEKEITTDGF